MMGIADDNKACINAKDFRKHKKETLTEMSN